MTEKEKAELLAAGEECLAFYKMGMEESMKIKNFPLAFAYERQHDGAARMLQSLGLLSLEEYSSRSTALFDHYMDGKLSNMWW